MVTEGKGVLSERTETSPTLTLPVNALKATGLRALNGQLVEFGGCISIKLLRKENENCQDTRMLHPGRNKEAGRVREGLCLRRRGGHSKMSIASRRESTGQPRRWS